jgi:hypothetical protein
MGSVPVLLDRRACQNGAPTQGSHVPYKIVWASAYLYISFTGHSSIRELNMADTEIYGDRRFPALQWAVWDFSQVDSVDATTADIESLAASDRDVAKSNSRIKLATVAPQPEIRTLAEHYVEMGKAHYNAWRVRIFETAADGIQWAISP